MEINGTKAAGSLFSVFLSGAAMGAVAGVLLAPRSGRESRAQLRHYLRRFGDQAQRGLEQGAAIAREAVTEGRRAMKQTTEAATVGGRSERSL